MTFVNFKKLGGTAEALAAFKQVLDGPRFMLLVFGGVGNGKTHLCNAAAIELCRRGLFTRKMDFEVMLSTLKRAINNPAMDYQTILRNYSFAERLIIDDIGASGSDTEFGDKILEQIVCVRYGRRLLTILSTNRDVSTLPERVRSRLEDKSTSFLILNKGADYRRLK